MAVVQAVLSSDLATLEQCAFETADDGNETSLQVSWWCEVGLESEVTETAAPAGIRGEVLVVDCVAEYDRRAEGDLSRAASSMITQS